MAEEARRGDERGKDERELMELNKIMENERKRVN